MKCVHDSLTGACRQTAQQVVFVPVDGRKVFLVCVLLILACVIWLVLWLHRGHRFEESS